jgi:hypothetical protein
LLSALAKDTLLPLKGSGIPELDVLGTGGNERVVTWDLRETNIEDSVRVAGLRAASA